MVTADGTVRCVLTANSRNTTSTKTIVRSGAGPVTTTAVTVSAVSRAPAIRCHAHDAVTVTVTVGGALTAAVAAMTSKPVQGVAGTGVGDWRGPAACASTGLRMGTAAG